MEILFSIIFGVIQGVTEFLPVSSTGHLVILHAIWPMGLADDLGFDAILHVGTLVALVLFFAKDLGRYLRAAFSRQPERRAERRLFWLLLLATVPAALLGYLFEDLVDERLRSIWIVVIALFIGGILFLLAERYSRQRTDLSAMRPTSALAIGTAQAIALIPGVSRSGSTIITGMAFGLQRAAAARFAFLLAIPIVFGAGIKKISELSSGGGLSSHESAYVVGFLASLVSGYVCIAYFLAFLQRRSLQPFAWYRIGLAGALAILLAAGVL